MSVDYYDTNKLRSELDAFDAVLEKMAFTPTAAPPPPMTAMPPQGGAPMDPNGQPIPPLGGMPVDPNGQPMPPQGGMPMDPAMALGGMPPMDPAAQGGGAVDPELEGALAELATNTQRVGEEVGAQRDQIDQLTQRLLQLELQMSALQDGLKQPAPVEPAPAEQPMPGNQI